MTTIRKIFSYDDLEDKDIADWVNSLPERAHSKHIRVAIRTYLNYLKYQDYDLKTPTRQSGTMPGTEKKKERKVNEDDEYVNINKSFLNDLGK